MFANNYFVNENKIYDKKFTTYIYYYNDENILDETGIIYNVGAMYIIKCLR